MVQNHMLQLLCLVAMEPPASMDADALRDEKLKVLRSLKPIDGDERRTARRCAASTAPARRPAAPVQGYLDELGKAASQHRDLRRAQGRDRQLALGRRAVLPPHRQAPGQPRLGNRHPVPADPALDLRRSAEGAIAPNQLIIRLQPDEGVKLLLMIKDPGPGGMRLREVPLDLSFAAGLRRAHARGL